MEIDALAKETDHFANPDALVSTDWVADHGKDADQRFIEVDVDTSAYAGGHIEGAVGWD